MPALILMDITMPVLDGLEAARMIRGMVEARDVVIVAFTSLHGNEIRARALSRQAATTSCKSLST